MLNNTTYSEVSDFVFSSIETSFGFYKNNLNLCREAFSEESVHDLRVSMRRMLAQINLLNQIFRSQYSGQITQYLKQKLKILNPLRDTQVQILKVNQLKYKFSTFYMFNHYLLTKEENLIHTIENSLQEFSTDDLEGLIFYLKLETKAEFQRKNISNNVLIDIAIMAYEIVKKLLSQANKNDLDSIHRVRLAFKKFRYKIEFLSPLLRIDDETKKQLKAYQTVMGEIQDNSVFLPEFENFISTQQDVKIDDHNLAVQYLLQERENLIEQFFNMFSKENSLANLLLLLENSLEQS